MAEYGLTEYGFNPPTIEELIARIIARQRSEIDSQLDTTATSVVGQLNGIYASALAQAWEAVQDMVDQLDPSAATGVWLENLCALSGVRRRQATASTARLTLDLNGGVIIPAGSIVSVDGNPSLKFRTTAEVSNEEVSAGKFTVDAVATQTGALFAAAGSITNIETSISGWNSATNQDDASLGLELETDDDLRSRRRNALGAPGSGTASSIYAALALLDGVTHAAVSENKSDYRDEFGVPGHAIECVVEGGDDEEIASAIWAQKPAGIQTHGQQSIPISDVNGVARVVSFSRPTVVRAYATVTILVYDSSQIPSKSEAVQRIANAIYQRTQQPGTAAFVPVGSPAYPQQLMRVIMEDVPGIINGYCNVGTAGFPSASAAAASRTFSVSARSRLVFSTRRVKVRWP